MQFQLCGPVLPPPKLSTERSTRLQPTETRGASLRAAEAIRRIDRLVGDTDPCHWCSSGLYEPLLPCPACGASGDRKYSRDLRSGMRPDIAAALVRYRREQRRSAPADHPWPVPVEIRPARIVSVR